MLFKSKKVLSILLIAVIVLGIVSTPIIAFAEEDLTVITILHTNDTHSRVNDGISFPKIAAKLKELKEENPNTILVDAGDTLHGQTFATISKGESIIKLMNAVGYSVMTPGNHDFNYGQERLLELVELAEFPIISSNVFKPDGTTLLEPYVILEMDGIKLGIFGLSTPETRYKTNPKNVEGLTFEDPVKVAQKIVEELKEKEVNAIIALAHLGIDEETKETSYLVRDNVEGIDLIIDGHSHSTLDEIDNEGKDTLIVSTGEYNNNLGIVNLYFKDGELVKVEPMLFTVEMTEGLQADEGIVEFINEINESNKQITSKVVGYTEVVLDGVREHVRAGETNLANLITDAMLAATGADIAITNGGGIRASIDVGDITMEEVITVLPFGNYVVVKEYTGAQILAALEHGTANYPNPAGGFPQVSGITYTLDLNKEVGNRISDVKVGEEELDLGKVYKVATNDFMAAGGDGYEMFKEGALVAEYPALDEILIEYIASLENIPGVVVPRMTVVEKVEEVIEEVISEEPVEAPVEEPAVAPSEPVGELITETYIVKPGDVLWRIAKAFGTTWEKLAEFNKLKNPHLIFPGQEILIPMN